MQQQGQLDAARAMLQRALSIDKVALGPNHPDVATTLHNLADLLRQQGEHVQAKDLAKRAVAIQQATLPKEHPDIVISQCGLINIRAEMPCSKCGVRGVKLKHCSVCKLQYYFARSTARCGIFFSCSFARYTVMHTFELTAS